MIGLTKYALTWALFFGITISIQPYDLAGIQRDGFIVIDEKSALHLTQVFFGNMNHFSHIFFQNYTHYLKFVQLNSNGNPLVEFRDIVENELCNDSIWYLVTTSKLKLDSTLVLITTENGNVCEPIYQPFNCGVQVKQEFSKRNLSLEIGTMIPSTCAQMLLKTSKAIFSNDFIIIQKNLPYPIYSYKIFENEMKNVSNNLFDNKYELKVFVQVINNWKYPVAENQIKYEELLNKFIFQWGKSNSISVLQKSFTKEIEFLDNSNTSFSNAHNKCINTEFVGVLFDPFIKSPHPRVLTRLEIKYMVDLVSTKFRMIWINWTPTLIQEFTQIHKWVVEVTVERNLESNINNVALLINVNLISNISSLNGFPMKSKYLIDVLNQLALTTKNATGTIKGFCLTNFKDYVKNLSESEISNLLNLTKNMANVNGHLFGVHIDSTFSNKLFNLTTLESIVIKFVNFIKYSDYEYTESVRKIDVLTSGNEFYTNFYKMLLNPLLKKRSAIQALNPNVSVIAELSWGRNWQWYSGSRNDFVAFIESVSNWATVHKFQIESNRAFDNQYNDCCGWWTITDYRNLSTAQVFVEIDQDPYVPLTLPATTVSNTLLETTSKQRQIISFKKHWKTNGVYQAKEHISSTIRRKLIASRITSADIANKLSEVFGLYVLKVWPNGGFQLELGNPVSIATEVMVNIGSVRTSNLFILHSIAGPKGFNPLIVNSVYYDDDVSIDDCSSYNNISVSFNSEAKYTNSNYGIRFGITVPTQCFHTLVDGIAWKETHCQMDFLILKTNISFSIYSYRLFERHMQTEILVKIIHLRPLNSGPNCNSNLEVIVHIQFSVTKKITEEILKLNWEYASIWGHKFGIRIIWATVFDDDVVPSGWLNVKSDYIEPKISYPYNIQTNVNDSFLDRGRIGVLLNWNVRYNDKHSSTPHKLFSYAEIVTMFEVISSKFSKILTLISAKDQEFSMIDAATYVNSNGNGSLSPTVSLIVVVFDRVLLRHDDNRKFHKLLAVVKRANEVCQNTVVGIAVIRATTSGGIHYEYSYNVSALEPRLDYFRTELHKQGLTFGSFLTLTPEDLGIDDIPHQVAVTKLFFVKSDFVAFNHAIGPESVPLIKSVEDFSRFVDCQLVVWKNFSKSVLAVNPNSTPVLVIGFGGGDDYIDREQTENLFIFWETLKTWSMMFNITIFDMHAFDDPTERNNFDRFSGRWSFLDVNDATFHFNYVDKSISPPKSDLFRDVPTKSIEFNTKVAEILCNFPKLQISDSRIVQEAIISVIGKKFGTIHFEINDYNSLEMYGQSFKLAAFALSAQRKLQISPSFTMKVTEANDELDVSLLSLSRNNTVQSVSLCLVVPYVWGDYRNMMNVISKQLHNYRRKPYDKLSIGFVLALYCDSYLEQGVYEEEKEAIASSDFVICAANFAQFIDTNVFLNKGAFQELFILYLNKLVAIRYRFREFNPKIVVKFTVSWPTGRNNSDFIKFYKIINDWATENNYPFILLSAFDDQTADRKNGSIATGWWTVKDYNRLDEENSYEEKQAEYFAKPQQNLELDDTVIRSIEKSYEINVYLGTSGGILLLICFLVIITLSICLRKARFILSTQEVHNFNDGNGLQTVTNAHFSLNGEEASLNLPYNLELEIPKENFNLADSEIIGMGNFGQVYKTQVVGLIGEVAVKIPKASEGGKEAVLCTLREIKILAYVGSHDNVVKLLGAYTKEIRRGIVYTVTELCSEGSLLSYLRSQAKETDEQIRSENDEYDLEFETVSKISEFEMFRLASEIANGMDFIANKKVVHADLAARNILLDSNKVAKICDFGLSRKLYNYTEYIKKNKEPLPWRWMALETLKKLEFSTMSDVWSYGITVWEIFSLGEVPYPRMVWNEEFERQLKSGMRPEKPRFASDKVYAIMQNCWKISPNLRPSFADLKKEFMELQRDAYEVVM